MKKVIGVIMLILMLAACGNDDDTNVELSMPIAEIKDNDLIIAGIASLPDGAILNYELSSANEIITGSIEVKEENWDLVYDITDFDEGPITAWVSFSPNLENGEQPAKVYEYYGDHGEKIISDQNNEVYGDREMTRVSVEKMITR